MGGGTNSLLPTVMHSWKEEEEQWVGGSGVPDMTVVQLMVRGAAARWGERLQMKQGHSCTKRGGRCRAETHSNTEHVLYY